MEAAIQFSRKMALADEEMIEAKAINRGAVDVLSPRSMLHACTHTQITLYLAGNEGAYLGAALDTYGNISSSRPSQRFWDQQDNDKLKLRLW